MVPPSSVMERQWSSGSQSDGSFRDDDQHHNGSWMSTTASVLWDLDSASLIVPPSSGAGFRRPPLHQSPVRLLERASSDECAFPTWSTSILSDSTAEQNSDVNQRWELTNESIYGADDVQATADAGDDSPPRVCVPSNPRTWTRHDVDRWLRWSIKQLQVDFDPDRFPGVDGPTLCAWESVDFVRNAGPSAGPLLAASLFSLQRPYMSTGQLLETNKDTRVHKFIGQVLKKNQILIKIWI